MRTLHWLPVLASLLITAPAAAQPHVIVDPLPSGEHQLPAIVADRTDGTLVGAMRTVGGEPRLVLTRRASDDGERWTYVADHAGHVTNITAMPDGSWLVAGQARFPDPDTTISGFLLVLEDDGRLRWIVSPHTRWVGFTPAVSEDGHIYVHGGFFRGSVRLPGGPRWRTSRRFGSFLAEIDPLGGTVRWGRTIESGDEGSSLTVTTDGMIAHATHRRRAGGRQDVLLTTFTDRGTLVAQRTFSFDAPTYARAIRALPDGGLAMLTSTEVTPDRTMRLGLFTSSSSEPRWVVLPAESSLVTATRADAPLEIFAPGAHAGIALPYHPLVRGLRVCQLDRASGAITGESWLAMGAPMTLGSLRVARGARTWVSAATDDAGELSLVVAPADVLRTAADPGDYAIADHRAALAATPTSTSLPF